MPGCVTGHVTTWSASQRHTTTAQTGLRALRVRDCYIRREE